MFVVTHVSIRTSDASRTPHGCPFAGQRNAPLPSGGQRTEDRERIIRPRAQPGFAACARSSDIRLATVARPARRDSQDRARSAPIPAYLIRRTDRHRQKAFELRLRTILPAVTFSDIRTDRFARPPDLIAQRLLFDPRQLQACAMNLERQTIGSLEDLKIFKRFHFRFSPSHRRRIQSVVRPLFSVLRIQSFGSRLEPRYIFGAETLKFRPVSCYAFFKGWLLLSQPPGCFGISTSFPT